MSNELVEHSRLEIRLSSAYQMLTEARDDFERLQVRDFAKAIQEAAGILKHKAIQVQASLLVADAERAIAKANPPQQGKRNDLNFSRREGEVNQKTIENFVAPDDEVIKPTTLRDIRQAHDKLTDGAYEIIKQQSTEHAQPLTRATLQQKSKPNRFMARSTGDYEWYTPALWIELIHETLGEIDLDPASSPKANEIVCAKRIFTAEDDGLQQNWHGTVFMNPPFRGDLITQFIDKLIHEHKEKRVTEAIILVNSCTETDWFQKCFRASSAFCFPSERINFVNPQGKVQQSHRPQTFFHFGDRASAFLNIFQEKGIASLTTSDNER